MYKGRRGVYWHFRDGAQLPFIFSGGYESQAHFDSAGICEIKAAREATFCTRRQLCSLGDRDHLGLVPTFFTGSTIDRTLGFKPGKPPSSSTNPLCMLTMLNFIRLGWATFWSEITTSNLYFLRTAFLFNHYPPWKTMMDVVA